MTVSSTTNRITYNCQPPQKEFPFTFKILEEEDLVVILKDANNTETILVLNTDYSVSEEPWETGGSITTLDEDAYAYGYTLTILRQLNLVQGADYLEGDAFPAETHEEQLDRLMMIAQQLLEKLDRTPSVQTSSKLKDLLIPVAANRAIGWDAAGEQITTLGTDMTIPELDFIGNYNDNLNTAVQQIGAAKKTLIINKTASVTSDLTTPDTLHVWVLQGGMISDGASEIDLTINSFEAGLYKCFDWEGGGTISFGSGAVKELYPELWGTDGTALQAAATCASSSGITLKGTDRTYETTVALNFGGIPRIEMGQSLIKQADASDQTLLVDLTTPKSGGIFHWELNVDGNMDNNAAIIGVKIEGTQSATLETKINAVECDTGINIAGNAEMGRHYLGVWFCTIGVLEESDAVYSPDENLLFISGGGCDTFYKKGGVTSTTSIVHLNCEGGQNDYAVIIDKNRLTILNGEIRGSDGGGVKVIEGSVVFNGFAIWASGTEAGAEYGLLVEDAVSVTGSINFRSTISNCAKIIKAGAINLDLFMRTVDGTGLTLGAVSRRALIRLTAESIDGNAFVCENGSADCHVTICGACDDITIDAGATQHTIRIPADLYDTPITNNGSDTKIVYYGSMSLAERDAIASPFEGMYVEDIRNADHLPSVYLNGAWRILTPDGVHTANGETVTAAAPALLIYGYSYIDSSLNDVAATLADGQFPGQIKTIVLTDATNAADGGTTVTVAQHEDGDLGVYTFKGVDDVCVFMWKSNEWCTLHSDLTA